MEENKKCGCTNDENGCDCNGEGHEDAVIYVTFEDEDREVACDVLGIFEVDDIEYIALAPQDEEDVLIYRYSEEGDDIKLDEIETDEEYDKVAAEFDEMFFADMEPTEETEE
ncbi:DUF1292 domain-containing protein [Cellulosilyticum sp. I15G10I2]|uniref:DUF1292 domain-containing protein n=1 Tax=Cellulosilyticum sp. I15G10I2 TaxID=1892843 RepID=UPI00085BD7EB|nr:DUF1292 domain-containing protein [Cellulosilyticum sp. I15G10I2]